MKSKIVLTTALLAMWLSTQATIAQERDDDPPAGQKIEFNSSQYRGRPEDGARRGIYLIGLAEHRMRPISELAELRYRVASFICHQYKNYELTLEMLEWSFLSADDLLKHPIDRDWFLASASLAGRSHHLRNAPDDAVESYRRAREIVEASSHLDDSWRTTMLADLRYSEVWAGKNDEEKKLEVLEQILADTDAYLEHFSTSLKYGHWVVLHCHLLNKTRGPEEAWNYVIETAQKIESTDSLSDEAKLIAMSMPLAQSYVFEPSDIALTPEQLHTRVEFAERMIDKLEAVEGDYRLEALDMAIAIDCNLVLAIPDECDRLALRINRRFETTEELFFFQSKHRNMGALRRAINLFHGQLIQLAKRTSIDRLETCFELADALIDQLESIQPDDPQIDFGRSIITNVRASLRRLRAGGN